MPGVTHIQVYATLHYDSGVTVSLSTPVFKKDIRDGDYFSDDQACAVIAQGGMGLASVVEQQTTIGLHKQIEAQIERQSDKRKPKYGDNFSVN